MVRGLVEGWTDPTGHQTPGKEAGFLNVTVSLGQGSEITWHISKARSDRGGYKVGGAGRLFLQTTLVLTNVGAEGMVKGGGGSDHGYTVKRELTRFTDKSRQLQGFSLHKCTVQITEPCDTGRKAWGIMGIHSSIMDVLNLRYLLLDGWPQPTFPTTVWVPQDMRPQYQENNDSLQALVYPATAIH